MLDALRYAASTLTVLRIITDRTVIRGATGRIIKAAASICTAGPVVAVTAHTIQMGNARATIRLGASFAAGTRLTGSYDATHHPWYPIACTHPSANREWRGRGGTGDSGHDPIDCRARVLSYRFRRRGRIAVGKSIQATAQNGEQT